MSSRTAINASACAGIGTIRFIGHLWRYRGGYTFLAMVTVTVIVLAIIAVVTGSGMADATQSTKFSALLPQLQPGQCLAWPLGGEHGSAELHKEVPAGSGVVDCGSPAAVFAVTDRSTGCERELPVPDPTDTDPCTSVMLRVGDCVPGVQGDPSSSAWAGVRIDCGQPVSEWGGSALQILVIDAIGSWPCSTIGGGGDSRLLTFELKTRNMTVCAQDYTTNGSLLP